MRQGDGLGPKLLATAQKRAQAYAKLRQFFAERGVLEVETPLLSRGVSLDLHIDFFSCLYFPGGHGEAAGASSHYLQTSPEPHLKRLLCHGLPDLFQITKAFRNGEAGARHNPEFTLVEWYRRDFDLVAMEQETLELCQVVVGPCEVIRLTWEEAFEKTLGINPLKASREALLALPQIQNQGLNADHFPTDADLWDFLMAHGVEPALDPQVLTSIRHYPSVQAAQSLVHAHRPELALRFEVFGHGLELGNGYQELRDAGEYRRRFEGELLKRKRMGKPQPPLDKALLRDLENLPLPACSGVAVGLDRLFMMAMKTHSIDEVLLFPWGSH